MFWKVSNKPVNKKIIFVVGFVEWKEYYKHFLLAKGHGLEETDKFLTDYDTDILKDNGKILKWFLHIVILAP